MKKKLIGIGTVVLILALLLTLAPACGNGDDPMTVTSSDTGTLCVGYTTTNPVDDPLNVASYGSTWSSAVTVDTTDLISAWWYDDSLVPDAAWVSSADPREGIHEEDQWRLFKEEFEIPAGHVVTSASLRFTADNAVAVYLNNVLSRVGVRGGHEAHKHFIDFDAGLDHMAVHETAGRNVTKTCAASGAKNVVRDPYSVTPAQPHNSYSTLPRRRRYCADGIFIACGGGGGSSCCHCFHLRAQSRHSCDCLTRRCRS